MNVSKGRSSRIVFDMIRLAIVANLASLNMGAVLILASEDRRLWFLVAFLLVITLIFISFFWQLAGVVITLLEGFEEIFRR